MSAWHCNLNAGDRWERSTVQNFYLQQEHLLGLTALPVNGKELRAGEVNRCRTEAAIATDPLANWDRIQVPKRSSSWFIDGCEAEKTRPPRCVKTKHCVWSHTDPIMRHNAEHERTSRRTGAIDNDLLASVAKCHIARPICADIAAAIIGYADGGGGLRQPPKEHRGKRYYERDPPTKHKFTVFYASRACRMVVPWPTCWNSFQLTIGADASHQASEKMVVYPTAMGASLV